MIWTSAHGRKIDFDAQLWKLSDSTLCRIENVNESHCTVVNENGVSVRIPVGVFRDNRLMAQQGDIVLSAEMYSHWILKSHREKANGVFNSVFNTHMATILDHPETVFSRAEYFFLRPHCFLAVRQDGGQKVHVSLGSMLESFVSGNHIYFDTFGGHEKIYLIHIAGSYLSGRYSALFWSAASRSVVYFPTDSMPAIPRGFGYNHMFLEKLARQDAHIRMDFQDKALEKLQTEISAAAID